MREEGRKHRVFEGRRCETRLAWACRSVEVTGSVQSGATGSFEN